MVLEFELSRRVGNVVIERHIYMTKKEKIDMSLSAVMVFTSLSIGRWMYNINYGLGTNR